MKRKLSVFWTTQAEQNIDEIFNFILLKWNDKIAFNFISLLQKFEERISELPFFILNQTS